MTLQYTCSLGTKKNIKCKNRDESDWRRTVMLERQEGKKQLEVGGKLARVVSQNSRKKKGPPPKKKKENWDVICMAFLTGS